MPDGYYTDEGRRDLKRFVAEAIKDWEAHSQRLAAAREAARKGREPLSLRVSYTLASLILTKPACPCVACQRRPEADSKLYAGFVMCIY